MERVDMLAGAAWFKDLVYDDPAFAEYLREARSAINVVLALRGVNGGGGAYAILLRVSDYHAPRRYLKVVHRHYRLGGDPGVLADCMVERGFIFAGWARFVTCIHQEGWRL